MRVNRPAAPLIATTTKASVDLPSSGRAFDRVTYHATITAESDQTPTGKLTFSMGAKRLCTTEPRSDSRSPKGTSKGSCSTPRLPVGDYKVTATYSGNTRFAGSSQDISFNVEPPKPGSVN